MLLSLSIDRLALTARDAKSKATWTCRRASKVSPEAIQVGPRWGPTFLAHNIDSLPSRLENNSEQASMGVSKRTLTGYPVIKLRDIVLGLGPGGYLSDSDLFLSRFCCDQDNVS